MAEVYLPFILYGLGGDMIKLKQQIIGLDGYFKYQKEVLRERQWRVRQISSLESISAFFQCHPVKLVTTFFLSSFGYIFAFVRNIFWCILLSISAIYEELIKLRGLMCLSLAWKPMNMPSVVVRSRITQGFLWTWWLALRFCINGVSGCWLSDWSDKTNQTILGVRDTWNLFF